MDVYGIFNESGICKEMYPFSSRRCEVFVHIHYVHFTLWSLLSFSSSRAVFMEAANYSPGAVSLDADDLTQGREHVRPVTYHWATLPVLLSAAFNILVSV